MQGRGCRFPRLDDTHVVSRVRATDTLSAFRLFFFGETHPAVLGKLRRKIRFCFCCWQKRFMSCFVCETWWGRMIAQSACLHKDLQKVCIYPVFFFFLPSPVVALSAIDVRLVSGMKQNSSQLCSTIVCWLLWHNDLHFARHLGRD